MVFTLKRVIVLVTLVSMLLSLSACGIYDDLSARVKRLKQGNQAAQISESAETIKNDDEKTDNTQTEKVESDTKMLNDESDAVINTINTQVDEDTAQEEINYEYENRPYYEPDYEQVSITEFDIESDTEEFKSVMQGLTKDLYETLWLKYSHIGVRTSNINGTESTTDTQMQRTKDGINYVYKAWVPEDYDPESPGITIEVYNDYVYYKGFDTICNIYLPELTDSILYNSYAETVSALYKMQQMIGNGSKSGVSRGLDEIAANQAFYIVSILSYLNNPRDIMKAEYSTSTYNYVGYRCEFFATETSEMSNVVYEVIINKDTNKLYSIKCYDKDEGNCIEYTYYTDDIEISSDMWESDTLSFYYFINKCELGWLEVFDNNSIGIDDDYYTRDEYEDEYEDE